MRRLALILLAVLCLAGCPKVSEMDTNKFDKSTSTNAFTPLNIEKEEESRRLSNQINEEENISSMEGVLSFLFDEEEEESRRLSNLKNEEEILSSMLDSISRLFHEKHAIVDRKQIREKALTIASEFIPKLERAPSSHKRDTVFLLFIKDFIDDLLDLVNLHINTLVRKYYNLEDDGNIYFKDDIQEEDIQNSLSEKGEIGYTRIRGQ